MSRSLVLPCLLLVLGVAGVYSRAAGLDFVAFDDDTYVTANPVVAQGLDAGSVRWAFTAIHGSNWHPLTWLSHMLDVQLFGLDPGPPHVENVAFHALNALLLFLFLAATTQRRWAAFLVAAFFAWHPLRVESVAWVAERKDVLSGAFFLLALLAYARYASRPAPWRYLLVLAVFALGLLAKPMLVTLPLVLLLLDLWPLRRLEATDGWRRFFREHPRATLLLEKVPFLLLAAASSLVTLHAQRSGGAAPSAASLAPLLRVENALASYGVYLVQTFWPVRLACFYPHALVVAAHPLRALLLPALLGVLLLAAGTFLAVRTWRRRPALAVGWSWYVVMLLPVIGLVQVGLQAHADRYTYLPSVGIALAVVYGLCEVSIGRAWLRVPAVLVGCAALGACVLLARRQVEVWTDSAPLFRHAIEVTDENFRAYGNLGHVLMEAGEWGPAAEALEQAARIHELEPHVLANLGLAYLRLGELERAEAPLRRAVQVEPGNAAARASLGELAYRTGDYETAIRRFGQALEIDGGRIADRVSLGLALLRLGRDEEALRSFETASAMDPAHPLPQFGLGEAARKARDWEVARRHYERALELDPDLAAAHASLATVLDQLGDPQGAARHRRAIRQEE